uniref:Bucky ball n=1 Tax=Myripristis murdjan TaxID=586833 RepID=A0A668AHC4_9TELE
MSSFLPVLRCAKTCAVSLCPFYQAMADMNNPTHSLGSGHPHHHHYVFNRTRPFFYVQPPSQPFYMYQWNMNLNPYGNPASGLPYMRQYMAPYPCMSGYPGYVIPQAPVYPVEYRHMFNPHRPSSSAYGVQLRHHHSRQTKETASSEVQTDQSDLLTKLTDSLDALAISDIAAKEGKEPVTPDTEVLPPKIVTQSSFDTGKTIETAMPSDSTAQEPRNSESVLNNMGKVVWDLKAEAHDKAQDDTQSLVSGIGILPLDSSSVNGEDEDVHFSCEMPCLAEKLHHTVALEVMNGKRNLGVEAEEDLPYRILRLPCDKVTTGMLQQDQPLWLIDPSTSTTVFPQNYMSVASSHSAYYSYYPYPTVQTCVCCGKSLGRTNERMPFGGGKGGSMQNEYQDRSDEAEEVVTEGAEVPHHVYSYSTARSSPHACPTPYLPPFHLYPKRRSRKTCNYEEHDAVGEMVVHKEQAEHGNGQGPDRCPPAQATRKSNKYKGRGQRNPPSRNHNECLQHNRPACKASFQQRPRRTYHDYQENEVSNSYRSRGGNGRNQRY